LRRRGHVCTDDVGREERQLRQRSRHGGRLGSSCRRCGERHFLCGGGRMRFRVLRRRRVLQQRLHRPLPGVQRRGRRRKLQPRTCRCRPGQRMCAGPRIDVRAQRHVQRRRSLRLLCAGNRVRGGLVHQCAGDIGSNV
jgi:hypothetical protein